MPLDVQATREFFMGMIPLAFNFAFKWKIRHTEESWEDILNERCYLVDLLQLSKNDKQNSTWQNLLKQAEDCWRQGVTEKFFEAKLTGLIIPYAIKRFKFFYSSRTTFSKKYPDGSLRYDAPLEKLPANVCNIHIANMVSPNSIFTEPDYLPECFFRLMEKGETKYGYDTLTTFTWLNSYPRWLELFPAEWHDNMDQPDDNIWGNLGYWGQLINAAGNINHKAEQYVRENGTLRYKPRKSYCSFEKMRHHLKKYLSECREC